jgi:hypothetical protein
VINYEGRMFQKLVTEFDEAAPTAVYRQDGDLVWAEIGGGDVRRGSLAGTCDEDGTIEFAYTMVLAGGEVISGRSVNTPEFLPDGRIKLNEVWERYGRHAETGVSAIVEVAR